MANSVCGRCVGILLAVASVYVTQPLWAAYCMESGCSRFANTSGYCDEHWRHRKQQKKMDEQRRSNTVKKDSKPKSSTADSASRVALPSVLMPDTSFDRAKAISDNERTWTDSKGRTITAKLTHVTEDGEKVFLTFSKNNKYTALAIDNLSSKDKEFVTTTIAQLKKDGKVWVNGVYLDSAEAELFKRREEAKALIVSKDDVAQTIRSLKIFQVLGNRALCFPGYMSDYGFRSTSSTPVMFVARNNTYFVDGDILNKRFYWCGTFQYETRGGTDRTVNIVSDDPAYCVEYLMSGVARSATAPRAPASESKNSGESLYCTGSGFFVTKDGYLVTNHHVVDKGSRFAVLTDSGRYAATIVFSDPDTDLALLKVNDIASTPIKFASKRTEGLGANVMTMGFPQPGLQGFEPKVTRGVISGTNGFMGDVRRYQIDASIQPGNSGGPLFNEKGCLVGVLVSSLTKGQVVNYAIKKSYLQAFLDNSSECANGIIEGDGSESTKGAEEVVEEVRRSCVLVLNYK